MLADAIGAETWRFARNRTAVFWSVLFVPAIALALSMITDMVTRYVLLPRLEDQPAGTANVNLDMGPVDVGQSLLSSAGDLANPAVLLFVLIGAATIYAGDYRWETWRLISARNSRPNLLVGKVATVAGVALLGMVAMLIAGVVADLVKAVVFARPPGFTFDGQDAGQTLALAGLSWLRILQFTMISLLAAVMTRSLLAALFVPLVIGVAQTLIPGLLGPMGVSPDSWTALLISPGGAVDVLKVLVSDGDGASSLPEGLWLKAVVSLAGWTLLPLAGALAWFQRQDLSKE